MAEDEARDASRWQALRERLEALPQAPVSRAHPRNWAYRGKRTLDLIGHSRPQFARFWRKANPYPKPFQYVNFRTEDGVQIAGWYGPPHPGPKAKFGIIVVPGIFATKDDTIHKARTIRMWRHWKVPVLAFDLRAFGESTGIATAGWKEALDVHAAALELRRLSGVPRVAVVAESLGGAAALNALAHDSRTEAEVMTGGVLAWSTFLDARDAVAHLSTEPPRDDPFRSAWAGFRRLLSWRSMGGYDSFADYLVDAARVNGLESVDELYDLANPKWKVPMMHHPVLCVHAIDDPVVPVRHARRMERYSREHANIETLVVPWGLHTSFEAMDPWWFWEVTRLFFGAVNDVELPNPTSEPEKAVVRAIALLAP